MVFYQRLFRDIHPDWLSFLESESQKEYFQKLVNRLTEIKEQTQIFPPQNHWFEAFKYCGPQDIKVVILGQDPYHGPGQAHGLAFSVPGGQKFPPSLRNILKEWSNDTGLDYPFSGDLSPWAKEGVLLLNSSLTVEKAKPGAHLNWGWEIFSDAVIRHLGENGRHLVFILWGKPAQSKKKLIPAKKHLIIESVHPSPLSAYRGFFDSKPFSRANAYLEKNGRQALKWELDL